MHADDNTARFILDGWDARGVHFGICAAWRRTAIGWIVIAGCSVPNAEACGIFDEDPGIEQTPVFYDAKHKQ